MEKLKVLLVDDECDFLETMTLRIQSWGYDVISVSNGKEGIEAVKNSKVDLVVLDYMMPEMDGVATLRGIRGVNKKIPVIMFTAYPDQRAIENSEELEVYAFIPKVSVYQSPQTSLKTAIDMIKKNR